jgi:hypothetical protein
MNVSHATRLRTAAPRPDVLVRETDGELVILDRTRGLVHQLNGTASLVWKRCNGDRSVRDIAAEVAATFDVSIDTAQRDIAATVRQLAELGLLVDAAQAGEGTGHTRREEG